MTKSQIFFWFLISFISGIAAASFLPIPLSLVAAVFILGGAVAVFGFLGLPARQQLCVAGLCVVLAAAGSLWFLRAGHMPASKLDAMVGQRITLTAIVGDDPVRRPQTQRLVVAETYSASRVLAVSRPFPEYGYGDRLRITGRLERPENFTPEFDYAAYLAKEDIYFAMSFPAIEILDRHSGSRLYRFLFGLKDRFAGFLERLLPQPHSAFMAGLTIGERESFPTSLIEALRITGTSHLVALSGYNITIVADALMAALMFLFLPARLAFWLALAGIWGFTLLTGAQASVVRAAVMGVLVLAARREGRLYRMRNALALAGALMLVHNPKILRFDTGFQLSFLATLGLVYLAPLVERVYEKAKLRLIPPAREAGLIRDRRDIPRRRKSSFLRNIFVSTMAAQLAVLPLLVYQFGTLSLVSPAANLAVIPFIPATMFLGFLTGGLAFLWEDLARLAAAPAWALLEYELSAIRAFAALPLASLEIRGLGLSVLIGGYALIGYWLWRRHNANTRILRK